jgi:hypothetical protein
MLKMRTKSYELVISGADMTANLDHDNKTKNLAILKTLVGKSIYMTIVSRQGTATKVENYCHGWLGAIALKI